MDRELNLLDTSFYKKRGHAVVACLSLIYLTIAYVAGVKVDISIFADIAIIAGSLILLPKIKLNGIESSNKLARNIFAYFFLSVVVFVAIGDAHELLSLPNESKSEFFSIIAQICMVLFGASKFEVSRNAIESAKDALNWKRGQSTMMANFYTGYANGIESEDAESDLQEEVKKMRTPQNRGKLLSAMQSYRGMCEIVGNQHNKKLLSLAKKAGFDWYTNDEIPWCAVMLNICCMIAGIPVTRSAMAKSFLKWGKPVNTEEARKNIGKVIAVFHRGKDKKDPSGHVTVVESISEDGKWMHGIGGNQGNCVKTSKMSLDNWRFIEFRVA